MNNTIDDKVDSVKPKKKQEETEQQSSLPQVYFPVKFRIDEKGNTILDKNGNMVFDQSLGIPPGAYELKKRKYNSNKYNSNKE